MSSTKSVLIIYATREGQTEKIARMISEHLSGAGAHVTLHRAGRDLAIDFAKFDFVLCGGSMHAGGIEAELVDVIKTHQDIIKNKANAFFLVLLSAATKDAELRAKWLADAKNKMNEQIPQIFQHTEMIAGALMYSKYSWPLKWIMKRIAQKAGEGTDFSKDYEYTDWNQVKIFANKISKMGEYNGTN